MNSALAVLGFRLIDNRPYCVLVWLAVLGCVLTTRRLLDSRVGRGLRALRTGAQAAASFGVALPATRLLLRSEGLTVLLVEHDMDFVMRLADRLVVLNFGTKLADGPPAEVARNPEVVEAYLGALA